MNNIVLIGMPGCGKSTLGVILAKTLGYDFIDTDLVIQKNEEKKLYEIIAEKGMDEFLVCENKAILSVNTKNTVIATGGSAILCAEAMEYLKTIGRIVYIKLAPEVIENRINNISTRGIVMEKGESIFDIYNKRAPLYEKYADYTVNACEDNIEINIEMIINML